MGLRKVLLWECTRREIREATDKGYFKVVILPVGSIEQHNEHLALIHDTASAVHIAKETALKLFPQVLVSYPIGIGYSEGYNMKHKGTLTLRKETLVNIVFDVCESFARNGFSKIILLNGHSKNIFYLLRELREVNDKLNIQVIAHSYWEAYNKEILYKTLETGKCPAHAAEFETSFALSAFPEKVYMEYLNLPQTTTSDRDEWIEKDILYASEAKLATEEKGKTLIDISVCWLEKKILRMLE